MKATLPWLAAVLVAVLAVPAARAQYYGRPLAPDACGPAFYAPNAYGAYYGPNYYVYPGFQPFNGMLIGPNAPRGNGPSAPGCVGPAGPGGPFGPNGPNGPGTLGSPGFPTHPWARSPRDFFMVDEENREPVYTGYSSSPPPRAPSLPPTAVEVPR